MISGVYIFKPNLDEGASAYLGQRSKEAESLHAAQSHSTVESSDTK